MRRSGHAEAVPRVVVRHYVHAQYQSQILHPVVHHPEILRVAVTEEYRLRGVATADEEGGYPVHLAVAHVPHDVRRGGRRGGVGVIRIVAPSPRTAACLAGVASADDVEVVIIVMTVIAPPPYETVVEAREVGFAGFEAHGYPDAAPPPVGVIVVVGHDEAAAAIAIAIAIAVPGAVAVAYVPVVAPKVHFVRAQRGVDVDVEVEVVRGVDGRRLRRAED